VPIGDRYSILEIVLTQLADQGFQQVTLAIGQLGHLIRAFVGDGSRWGLEIVYVEENQPLGTIGPLLQVLDRLPDHLLVMNGDILTDLNYADMLREHTRSESPLTVSTYQREVTLDFGVLEVKSGQIVAYSEKPTQRHRVSMGVYAISTSSLRRYPVGEHFGFDELVLDLMRRRTPPNSYAFNGYWLDIGRPEDYSQANEEFARWAPRLLPSGVRHLAGECPATDVLVRVSEQPYATELTIAPQHIMARSRPTPGAS
jgi:NDP-sugar pyrophosphorylase family protein